MAKHNSTHIKINALDFNGWLFELLLVSESLEYVLDLLPEEQETLSSTLSLFPRRMRELLFGGSDLWDGCLPDSARPLRTCGQN